MCTCRLGAGVFVERSHQDVPQSVRKSRATPMHRNCAFVGVRVWESGVKREHDMPVPERSGTPTG